MARLKGGVTFVLRDGVLESLYSSPSFDWTPPPPKTPRPMGEDVLCRGCDKTFCDTAFARHRNSLRCPGMRVAREVEVLELAGRQQWWQEAED